MKRTHLSRPRLARAKRFAIPMVLILSCLAIGTAHGEERRATEPTSDLAVTFGIRWVDPAGWDEFSRQQSIGADFSWRRPWWPLFLALDVHAGGKTNSEYDPLIRRTVYTNDGSHVEFAGGLRWIAFPRGLVLSAGAGLAWAYGVYGKDTLRVTPGQPFPDQNGSGWGPWADAGVRVRIGRWYSAGLGARVTRARGDLYQRRVDLGGWQAYVTFVGATWPVRPARSP